MGERSAVVLRKLSFAVTVAQTAAVLVAISAVLALIFDSHYEGNHCHVV